VACERVKPNSSLLRLSQPQGHSAIGRIMSMKNYNDTIGNRTCGFLACSVVPQPTAPRRTSSLYDVGKRNGNLKLAKKKIESLLCATVRTSITTPFMCDFIPL